LLLEATPIAEILATVNVKLLLSVRTFFFIHQEHHQDNAYYTKVDVGKVLQILLVKLVSIMKNLIWKKWLPARWHNIFL